MWVGGYYSLFISTKIKFSFDFPIKNFSNCPSLSSGNETITVALDLPLLSCQNILKIKESSI